MVVLADYRGSTVEQMTELRARVRDASGSAMVVNNALLGVAAKELAWTDVERFLFGPTVLICGTGDEAGMAKVVVQSAKSTRRLAIKGGRMGVTSLTAADIEQLAATPPREVLLAQMLGTLAAPMTHLVGALSQKLASVVYVLKAIEEKKKGEIQQ